MNMMLQSALHYAGRGWPVFRLSTAKVPLKGSHAQLDATTDPAVIEEWFSGRGARLNLGLACGDLVVIDADGPGGEAEWEALCAPHGGIPVTQRVKTKRGHHYYFRKPQGAGDLRKLDAERDKTGDDGVDIRAGGSYVVLPPSINRKTGFQYEWVKPYVPIIDLPQWLVDHIVSRGGRREPKTLQVAPPMALGARPTYLIDAPDLTARATKGLRRPLDWVLARLKRIPASTGNLDWFKVSCCVYDWDCGFDGLAIFKAWSRTSARHDWATAEPACEKEWENRANHPAGEDKLTHESLDFLAEKYSPTTVDMVAPSEPIKEFPKETNGSHSVFAEAVGATAPIVFPDKEKGGKAKASCRNARVAIRGLGITCEHDTFHNKMLLGGKAIDQWSGELSDDATQMLRVVIERQFGFDPGLQHAHDAAVQECLLRPFDPVANYLGTVRWDGVPRVATWLTTYMGASDTPLARATGTLALAAAVRRVRAPGTKFDQVIVLESPEGRGKSSAIEILAGPENFSDQLILTLDDKGQQEAVQGVWLYEIGDLAGMGRADVERVKAFASRKVDRARPAYGRTRVDRPRRCVFFATTNDDTYLISQTGNRRFWPVRVGRIDLDALARDRDQLWAEAMQIERCGMALALPERFWEHASIEQGTRQVHDAWVDLLAGVTGRVTSDCVDEYRVTTYELYSAHLKLGADRLSPLMSKRLGYVMRRLGWQGPKVLKFEGNVAARGYWRPKVDQLQ